MGTHPAAANQDMQVGVLRSGREGKEMDSDLKTRERLNLVNQ